MPGVEGVVTQLDSSPTVLGEYWHTVRTAHGDRREPGSNIKLVPIAATNKPREARTPEMEDLLPPDKAIPLLQAQLQEEVETLRHDDGAVDTWERVSEAIVAQAFGNHSTNYSHFVCTVSYAMQSDPEKQAWHVDHIRSKKDMLRSFIRQLEVVPPRRGQASNRKLADQIHFHGPNARMNLDSIDQSINNASTPQLFQELRQQAGLISDAGDRSTALARIDEMEHMRGTGGFMAAYQGFITSAANHMTLFAPLLPLLSQLLS